MEGKGQKKRIEAQEKERVGQRKKEQKEEKGVENRR